MWSELTAYAGKVFWNLNKKNHSNDKVANMIGQMANFKCEEGCYSIKYSSSYTKPKIWWQMIDDSNVFLKSVAIKIFSITPHSVTCERTFSILGFLYGKRRQSLNLNTLEMMAKVRYYLLSNIKEELNRSMGEITEVELENIIEKCGFFDDEGEEDEEEKNNEDLFSNSYVEPLEILTHEVQVLIINDIVDMSNPAFIGGFEEIVNNDSSNEDEENDESLKEELDFEIISRILPPINMQ
jgi:hypothetical protein